MRAGVFNAQPLLLMSLLGQSKRSCLKINGSEEAQDDALLEVQSPRAEDEVPSRQQEEWETLERLVRAHKFTCNRNRTNLGGECIWYGNRRCLLKGVYSNTRKQGPILEHVRRMLGEDISAVTLNRNVQCGVHRNRRNSTKSWICFLGDFKGGQPSFGKRTDIQREAAVVQR